MKFFLNFASVVACSAFVGDARRLSSAASIAFFSEVSPPIEHRVPKTFKAVRRSYEHITTTPFYEELERFGFGFSVHNSAGTKDGGSPQDEIFAKLFTYNEGDAGGNVDVPTMAAFAIADGHGPRGEIVAQEAVQAINRVTEALFSNVTSTLQQQENHIRRRQELFRSRGFQLPERPIKTPRESTLDLMEFTARTAFDQAHEIVVHPDMGRGGGCTLTLLIRDFRFNQVLVASVGDSPAYYVDSENETLVALSHDSGMNNYEVFADAVKRVTAWFDGKAPEIRREPYTVNLVWNNHDKFNSTAPPPFSLEKWLEMFTARQNAIKSQEKAANGTAASDAAAEPKDSVDQSADNSSDGSDNTKPSSFLEVAALHKKSKNVRLAASGIEDEQIDNDVLEILSRDNGLSFLALSEVLSSALGSSSKDTNPSDSTTKTAVKEDGGDDESNKEVNLLDPAGDMEVSLGSPGGADVEPLIGPGGHPIAPNSVRATADINIQMMYEADSFFESCRLGGLQMASSIGDPHEGFQGSEINGLAFVQTTPVIRKYDLNKTPMNEILITSDGISTPLASKVTAAVYEKKVAACAASGGTDCWPDPLKELDNYNEPVYKPFWDALQPIQKQADTDLRKWMYQLLVQAKNEQPGKIATFLADYVDNIASDYHDDISVIYINFQNNTISSNNQGSTLATPIRKHA